MTDLELLELAANAMGGEYREHPLGGRYLAFPPNWNGVAWNPLEKDEDAFRLMVKFRMWRECDDGICCVESPKDHGGDENKAARRAIVRAAAEIGKATQEKIE